MSLMQLHTLPGDRHGSNDWVWTDSQVLKEGSHRASWKTEMGEVGVTRLSQDEQAGGLAEGEEK